MKIKNKLKSILKRINGINTPFGGVSWSPNNNNKDSTTTKQTETDSTIIKKTNPVLIKLTYKLPTIMPEDKCIDGICEGEYILIGENVDTIRVDSPKCKEFKPESYRYDNGPYDPKTGTYTKLISDWQGTEIRKCGWFDIPKNRIISKENISYTNSVQKQVWNYDTFDEFGSKIIK